MFALGLDAPNLPTVSSGFSNVRSVAARYTMSKPSLTVAPPRRVYRRTVGVKA